jgi:dTDP-4-amino-4,6-dideoxygalactose transaminase
MDRDTFIENMKEHNIGIGYHHHSAHLYTYYQKTYGYKQGQFPNAEITSDRIVSLPLFANMTLADQDRVIEAIKKVFKK